ncbi:hypothetical protein BpHYR1_049758 [Brachionus plicatilis]|uniref:Uncharacterized protein n=1 Tax=Brachionus plicatilis TaxID=10195 RepID=A0A3M7RLU2_BRAPC|nr:hypothetical protein BpHYR1_049758 [Brachionus plicatilis]
MTGISRIAVVVGLGINCCAYAQGVYLSLNLDNSWWIIHYHRQNGYHTGCHHPSRFASSCMQIVTCSLPLTATTIRIYFDPFCDLKDLLDSGFFFRNWMKIILEGFLTLKLKNLRHNEFLTQKIVTSSGHNGRQFPSLRFIKAGEDLRRSIKTCSNASNKRDRIDGPKGTNASILFIRVKNLCFSCLTTPLTLKNSGYYYPTKPTYQISSSISFIPSLLNEDPLKKILHQSCHRESQAKNI